ncbi:Pentatricopeptide repeat-containing protein At1g74850 [Durusdinium trenchii]|uniref:Chloroplastic (Protein PLASTID TRANSCRIPTIONALLY ACTIVE 2) n=1 Tax=Durusdinium trenchii TaxID=1381693 RepID=A0ABP0I6P1_9DINO
MHHCHFYLRSRSHVGLRAGAPRGDAKGWPSARCLLLQLRAEGLQQPKAAAESLRGHEKQGPLTGCGHTTINVATLRPWYGALITTLGHEERWEHCLEMMQEMDSQRLESNVILYGAAISACEKAAQWPSAVALLQQQRSEHLESSLICCSAAMTACARGSEWALSLSLLSTTRAAGLQVDVIMLSSGISACAQGTEWQGCLALLRDMSSEELCPNQIAYNAAADGLSRCNQWILTLEILREMRQCNLWPDAGTISSAVKSCGLAAEWQHALMAFQQIPEDQLDIVAFHSAVGACEQAGQWEAAVQLLQELRLGRLVADAQILSSALSVAARSGAWDIALALLGFGPVDAAVRNAAISACAQGSRWHVALSLLPSDYVGYCAAISACGATAAWRAAVVVLEDMLLQEMEVDSVAYNALMTSLEGSREWAIGLQLLEQMLASHLRPEEVALAAVLGRLLRHRQVADLPRLLTHLEEEGARRVTSLRGQKRVLTGVACDRGAEVPEDLAMLRWHRGHRGPTAQAKGNDWRQVVREKGLHSLPSGNAQRRSLHVAGHERRAVPERWDKALGILQKMREDGPPPDAFCCNSAIKACNNLKQQLQVFDGMCHLGPSPDIATYGALTSSLGRVARWEDCLEMLRELDSQSLESNLIVYSAAISACDKGSQWQVAIDLLERLEDQETSLVCCSAAMSACARGSQWELALDLLATTRSAGLQFDLIMFSTGISAGAQGSQWQLSLGLFRELQCQQLPNQIAYNAAADALSR